MSGHGLLAPQARTYEDTSLGLDREDPRSLDKPTFTVEVSPGVVAIPIRFSGVHILHWIVGYVWGTRRSINIPTSFRGSSFRSLLDRGIVLKPGIIVDA